MAPPFMLHEMETRIAFLEEENPTADTGKPQPGVTTDRNLALERPRDGIGGYGAA
ncbi:MAG: hypothetical protein ABSC06_24005 [Rhodopila sp.]